MKDNLYKRKSRSYEGTRDNYHDYCYGFDIEAASERILKYVAAGRPKTPIWCMPAVELVNPNSLPSFVDRYVHDAAEANAAYPTTTASKRQ